MRRSLVALAAFAALAAGVFACSSSTTLQPGPGDEAPEIPPDGGATAAQCVDVDLQADADHCGACGHSCFGGACTRGVCQPTVLMMLPEAENLPFLGGLGVADEGLYVARGPGLWFVPTSGAGAPAMVAEEPARAGNIVVDGDHVYWESMKRSLVRTERATSQTLAFATKNYGSWEVVLAEGGAYVDDLATESVDSERLIVRIDLSSKSRKTIRALSPDHDWSWHSMATAGGRVFWTDRTGVSWLELAGGVITDVRLQRLHGDLRGGVPWRVAGDSEAAYVLVMEDGSHESSLQRVDLVTRKVTEVAFLTAHPIAIAVDDRYVYVLDNASRRFATTTTHVVAYPKSGGEPVVLIDGVASTTGHRIGLDARSVYLVTDDRIVRVAKPL